MQLFLFLEKKYDLHRISLERIIYARKKNPFVFYKHVMSVPSRIKGKIRARTTYRTTLYFIFTTHTTQGIFHNLFVDTIILRRKPIFDFLRPDFPINV